MSIHFPESEGMMDMQNEKVWMRWRRVQTGLTDFNEPVYAWKGVPIRGQLMPGSGGLRMAQPGFYILSQHQFYTRWRKERDGGLVVRPKDVIAGPGAKPFEVAYSVEYVADEGSARMLIAADVKQGTVQALLEEGNVPTIPSTQQ